MRIAGLASLGKIVQIVRRHGNPQFLFQLTNQRQIRTFPFLDLTAGKLPQAPHRPAQLTLMQQNQPIRSDQRRRHDGNGCRIILHVKVRSQQIVRDGMRIRPLPAPNVEREE